MSETQKASNNLYELLKKKKKFIFKVAPYPILEIVFPKSKKVFNQTPYPIRVFYYDTHIRCIESILCRHDGTYKSHNDYLDLIQSAELPTVKEVAMIDLSNKNIDLSRFTS